MIKNKSRITIKKLKPTNLPQNSNLEFQTIEAILNSLFMKDIQDAEKEFTHIVQDEFNLSEKCAKQYIRIHFDIIAEPSQIGPEHRYDIPGVDIIAVRKSGEEILNQSIKFSKDCEKQLRDNNV